MRFLVPVWEMEVCSPRRREGNPAETQHWSTQFLNPINSDDRNLWVKPQNTMSDLGYHHFSPSSQSRSSIYNVLADFMLIICLSAASSYNMQCKTYSSLLLDSFIILTSLHLCFLYTKWASLRVELEYSRFLYSRNLSFSFCLK